MAIPSLQVTIGPTTGTKELIASEFLGIKSIDVMIQFKNFFFFMLG